jgi:hypothetical protein
MDHERADGATETAGTVATFTPPAPGIVVRAGTLGLCLAVMDG